MRATYATITIELSKAGLHAYCEELEEDVFCVNGDLTPLVELINDAETFCNPDTTFSLTEKGMQNMDLILKDLENAN